MGGSESKVNFRRAIVELETGSQGDEAFWESFWASDGVSCAQDVWALVPSAEVRALREEHPSLLATLIYKGVARLRESLKTAQEHPDGGKIVLRETLNSARLLTRITPLLYEDVEWIGFYHSKIPSENGEGVETKTLAEDIVEIVIELLFTPGIGAHYSAKVGESSLDCIWEAGVGVLHSPPSDSVLDNTRTELLRLLITLSSESLYLTPVNTGPVQINTWVKLITKSKHSLSILASLLNTVCSYDPSGVPYHHLLFNDTREPLVEVCSQLLAVCFEKQGEEKIAESIDDENGNKFLFLVNRLHREEDFQFIIKGITRLLNNPLQSSYLPSSQKRLSCHQELLLLIWRLCDSNKKFLHHILKTSEMLDLIVPILHYLNEAREDPCRLGLVHISVFLLLLLSGERNFGVRLNAPWQSKAALDVPSFNGSHGDLLIIVFHKLITSGHARISSLYDCLLTIIVNISPYLKKLTMVTATKILHLIEAFCQPTFLFAQQQNHHLIFFLLETVNNLVQYQFDGNAPLVYCVIRRRKVFHQLAALPTDENSIDRVRCKRGTRKSHKTRHEKLSKIERENREAEMQKSENSSSTNSGDDSISGTKETNLTESKDEPSQNEPENDLVPHNDPSKDPELIPQNGENKNEKNVPEPHEEAQEDIMVQHVANVPLVNQMTTEYVDGDRKDRTLDNSSESDGAEWTPTSSWAIGWKSRLPLQTIMRLLQVLVPQIEKICLEKQISDENDVLKFIQQGTLVGLLPVPHPILIRRYQTNIATNRWLQTYTWGVIYLRNSSPPIWFDTDVKLFEIQKY